MEQDGTLTFRLPRRLQFVPLAIAILWPVTDLLIDFHFGMIMSLVPGLIAGAEWLLIWIFLVPRYTVQLRPDGIKLYSLWWLPWTDVRDVRHWKVLGLPHFRVKRRHGLWSRIWIPLYFIGDCDLAQAIVHAAPIGNPFRSVSIPPPA